MRASFLSACLLAAMAISLPAQKKYDGPVPDKTDVLYLLHASDLVETETADAKEEKRKDDIAYVVNGTSSTVKTPLAEPIFMIKTKTLQADKLQLYKLEATKNGRREVVMPPPNKRGKNSPRPLHLSLKRVADGIYRIEANEFLQNGEYGVTPEGSNQVFCFQVY